MKSLPENQQRIIDNYFHIKVGSFSIPCPYYMNKRGRRFLRPVDAGKGTPKEIEAEVERWRRKFNSKFIDEVAARNFMRLIQLGVDCSGFVVNVLGVANTIKYPDLISRLKSWLRPRTNISADLLTGPFNSFPVTLSEIRAGDLIRVGKTHVMLVERIDNDRIIYVSSGTRPEWGVQRGEIRLINPADNRLDTQEWKIKEDWEAYKAGGEESGLRRLKCYGN